jgi:hypothetical protein
MRESFFYSQLYSVDDVLVASTAADIARNGSADFLFVGMGIFF